MAGRAARAPAGGLLLLLVLVLPLVHAPYSGRLETLRIGAQRPGVLRRDVRAQRA
jgi:hypothetical protein